MPKQQQQPPMTPDGHYIVVRGRLWRATNPTLEAEERQRHVDALQAWTPAMEVIVIELSLSVVFLMHPKRACSSE